MSEELENIGPVESIVSVTLLCAGNIAVFIGNLLVCLATYRNHHLRTPTNLYVTALAVIGLLFSCFVGPSFAATLIARQWTFSDAYCKLQALLLHFTRDSTLHMISLTAFKRYCRIVKPSLHRQFFPSRARSCAILACVWLYQVVLITLFCIPVLSEIAFNAEQGSCRLTFHSRITEVLFALVKLSAYLLLSALVVLVCYYKVFHKIRKHKLDVSSSLRLDNIVLKVNVEAISVTGTLVAMVLLFLLCWIPELILSVVLRLKPGILSPTAQRALLIFLSFSCSASAFPCASTNREFRAEFKRILISKERRGAGGRVEPAVVQTGDVSTVWLGHKLS